MQLAGPSHLAESSRKLGQPSGRMRSKNRKKPISKKPVVSAQKTSVATTISSSIRHCSVASRRHDDATGGQPAAAVSFCTGARDRLATLQMDVRSDTAWWGLALWRVGGAP